MTPFSAQMKIYEAFKAGKIDEETYDKYINFIEQNKIINGKTATSYGAILKNLEEYYKPTENLDKFFDFIFCILQDITTTFEDAGIKTRLCDYTGEDFKWNELYMLADMNDRRDTDALLKKEYCTAIRISLSRYVGDDKEYEGLKHSMLSFLDNEQN